MQFFSKLHEVLKIGHWDPIIATKQKKWMVFMDSKIIHGWYAFILFKIFLLTLFTSFNWNLICFQVFLC
jgi:hypothetical protein